MDRSAIDAFFDEHREQMLQDLCHLISIPSVRGPEEAHFPYGREAARALDSAAAIAKRLGLHVRDFDHYVATADLNDRPPELGILVHLDVVAEGDGWTFPPYQGTVRDGKVYGRGAIDDKGPAIAALYAMKAAQLLEPELSKGARLILGSAEETGSSDLAWYMKREAMPASVFSPDADYPVINIEKGRYAPVFEKSWQPEQLEPRVISFSGGTTANIVPQTAWALVTGDISDAVRTVCLKAEAETGVSFSVSVDNKQIRVTASGKGGHAARPEDGNNAQTALLTVLAQLPLANTESTQAIRDLAALFPHGDVNGSAIGIAQGDELSGGLTVNFSRLEINGTGLVAQFDSRTPICAAEDTVSRVVERRLASCGMEITQRPEMVPYHHTSADTPLVRKLLEVYERYTGQKGTCIAVGGGTYVHKIDGGVAFGCCFPGEDNHMHGPDEYVDIERLILSAKMFTQVILDLCR